MIGKIYKDKLGTIRQVVDIIGDVVVFNDDVRISIDKVNELFTETNNTQSDYTITESINYNNDDAIDPSSFFKKGAGLGNSIINASNGIDLNNMSDSGGSGISTASATVTESISPFERAPHVAAPVQTSNKNIEDTRQKMIELQHQSAHTPFSLNEDNLDVDSFMKGNSQQFTPVIPAYDPSSDTSNRIMQDGSVIEHTDSVKSNTVVSLSPMQTMFKTFKRNTDFSFPYKIEGKVPSKEFIKIWEESCEESIIDFLANDIYSNIIKNPTDILESIKTQIRESVYGKPKTKLNTKTKPVKKPVTKRTIPNVPSNDRSQMIEGVVKKTKTSTK